VLVICQAPWVWFIIVSCSAVLTLAILAAVAAFAAAAFAVLPRDEYKVIYGPLAVGGSIILAVFAGLAVSTWAARPIDTGKFVSKLLGVSWLKQEMRRIYSSITGGAASLRFVRWAQQPRTIYRGSEASVAEESLVELLGINWLRQEMQRLCRSAAEKGAKCMRWFKQPIYIYRGWRLVILPLTAATKLLTELSPARSECCTGHRPQKAGARAGALGRPSTV